MPITAIPVFRVSSRAVLDQWVEAFGFELVFITGDTHPTSSEGTGGETISHAELRLADAWVMAGTPKGNEHDHPLGSTGSYWVLDDAAAVDAVHARALAAGAGNVNEPYEPPYGGRECSLRDLDGNFWSFGTYAPGASG